MKKKVVLQFCKTFFLCCDDPPLSPSLVLYKLFKADYPLYYQQCYSVLLCLCMSMCVHEISPTLWLSCLPDCRRPAVCHIRTAHCVHATDMLILIHTHCSVDVEADKHTEGRDKVHRFKDTRWENQKKKNQNCLPPTWPDQINTRVKILLGQLSI